MDITGCKLCGRVVSAEGNRICPNCMHRLQEVYSQIHNYMRDNQEDKFNIESLSEDLDVNPADVQMLIELGYIDRKLAEDSRTERAKRKIAGMLSGHVYGDEDDDEDTKHRRIMTYGGEKYARGSDSSRQYVYDAQVRSAHKK